MIRSPEGKWLEGFGWVTIKFTCLSSKAVQYSDNLSSAIMPFMIDLLL